MFLETTTCSDLSLFSIWSLWSNAICFFNISSTGNIFPHFSHSNPWIASMCFLNPDSEESLYPQTKHFIPLLLCDIVLSGHLMFVIGREFTIQNLTSYLANKILTMFRILMPPQVVCVGKSLSTYRTREDRCLFHSFPQYLSTGFLVSLYIFTRFHCTTNFTFNGYLYFAVYFGIMFFGKFLSTFWALIWNTDFICLCLICLCLICLCLIYLCFIIYDTIIIRIFLLILVGITLGFIFLRRKVQIIYLLIFSTAGFFFTLLLVILVFSRLLLLFFLVFVDAFS